MKRTLAALTVALAACSGEENLVPPDWGLNRMVVQPKYLPYGESAFFADGRTMQAPPAGTVARERVLGPLALTEGGDEAGPVTAIPVPLTRALLARGRDRYDTFCAPCHGTAGDGVSAVARNMPLVKPPSLVAGAIRAKPPGHLYRVIARGYGMMPGYEDPLPIEDRWAVVGYVKALQLAAGTPLAELPDELRRLAEEALP